MEPIKMHSVAAVIAELQSKGWQRNGKLRTSPPFTFHHPVESKMVVIVQKMPSGAGHAHFRANW